MLIALWPFPFTGPATRRP